MLIVKQGGIKCLFLSFSYDSTWDWNQVSRAIGKHSNIYMSVYVYNLSPNVAFMTISYTYL